MSNEKKPFTGASLIINLNHKDDPKDSEPGQTLAFFAPKGDAKVFYSADRISDAENAPAKYVAFPTKNGFDVVESTQYAEQKALANQVAPEVAKSAKGIKIGVLFAHHYVNGQGQAGVLHSGGFNVSGIGKDAKIGEQPFRALASFRGNGAEPVAKAQADAWVAAKAKREAKAEGAAGGEAPAESKPKQEGPELAF